MQRQKKRKVIKVIPAVNPKKLKKLIKNTQTKEKPRVSYRLDVAYLLFIAISVLCFFFKFGNVLNFVTLGAKNFVVVILVLIIFIILCLFWIVLSGYATGYESIQEEIGRLKRAHRKAEQGDVFQVQEEIELNGKRFIVPVKSNSGIASEFQLAIEKAEEVLSKKKKIYNFLARITFCKEKEIFYGKV